MPRPTRSPPPGARQLYLLLSPPPPPPSAATRAPPGDNFNRVARELDANLSALGGTRLLPLGSIDEDSGVDVAVQFRAWARALSALSRLATGKGGAGTAEC